MRLNTTNSEKKRPLQLREVRMLVFDKYGSRLLETLVADPSTERAPDPETGHLQHLARHRVFVKFFRFHVIADRRHVQFVQPRPAERDRRHLLRGDLQPTQQLATGTVHVQHL